MTPIFALNQFNQYCEAYIHVLEFSALYETMDTAQNTNQMVLLNSQIRGIVKSLKDTDKTCGENAQDVERYLVKSIYYLNFVYRGNRANRNTELEFLNMGNQLVAYAFRILSYLIDKSPVDIQHYFNDSYMRKSDLNIKYYEKAIEHYHLV